MTYYVNPTGKTQASISFQNRVLKIIDDYSFNEDLSRTQTVNRMIKEFIINHNLDPDNTLGWN